MAIAFLESRGFIDKSAEHPWNQLHMERAFGDFTLTVWGRHWSQVIVQIYQDADAALSIAEVSTREALAAVVDKTIEFLSFIEGERWGT